MTTMEGKQGTARRKTIRLTAYDYAENGYYFITVCTQNRAHIFGEIVGATLCGRPNGPHKMVEAWLLELERKYPDIRLGPYVVMPNHVHFILEKTSGQAGDHTGSPLRDIVGWFKTMTTNDYIRRVKSGEYTPFAGRLWQRNYYEHVIRNEEDYLEIAAYIENNPARWEEDRENKEPKSMP